MPSFLSSFGSKETALLCQQKIWITDLTPTTPSLKLAKAVPKSAAGLWLGLRNSWPLAHTWSDGLHCLDYSCSVTREDSHGHQVHLASVALHAVKWDVELVIFLSRASCCEPCLCVSSVQWILQLPSNGLKFCQHYELQCGTGTSRWQNMNSSLARKSQNGLIYLISHYSHLWIYPQIWLLFDVLLAVPVLSSTGDSYFF